jgi:hypothetical protein
MNDDASARSFFWMMHLVLLCHPAVDRHPSQLLVTTSSHSLNVALNLLIVTWLMTSTLAPDQIQTNYHIVETIVNEP